jgi:2-oxoisovalerate dehydrogenase E1 component beta subunit
VADITTYIDAVSQGLREEMRRDENVICVGLDIGEYGGPFGITRGFLEEFGAGRMVETPISESAFMGLSMGAALMGLRPVVELQFADFLSSCFNQLVNNSAKYYYIHGVPVPLVVRCPCGGGVHGGPFHSQNNESWFLHVPGLKIVAPSTPYDAKGLLKAAIRDNNPVIFMEHKYLYRRVKETLPEEDYVVPIGKGILRRVGDDVSVITYGSTVHMTLEAAVQLEQDGISIEVIDLRSVMPFDRELILKSVKKTGKALIIHEESLTGGVGAELASIIGEEAYEYMDGPVRRIAALDTPVPFSPPLEEYYFPNAKKIAAALRELVDY